MMELFYKAMLQGRSNLLLRDKEGFKPTFLDRLLKIHVSKCLFPPAACEFGLLLTVSQSCRARAPPCPAAVPCRRGSERCRPSGPSRPAAAAPSACSPPAGGRSPPACGPQGSASPGCHIPKRAKKPQRIT